MVIEAARPIGAAGMFFNEQIKITINGDATMFHYGPFFWLIGVICGLIFIIFIYKA